MYSEDSIKAMRRARIEYHVKEALAQVTAAYYETPVGSPLQEPLCTALVKLQGVLELKPIDALQA